MEPGPRSGCGRRRVLAATAGSLTATVTAGCMEHVRSLASREPPDQLSLTIATLPASKDPYAVRIATRLADNLEISGIDTVVDPMRPDVLFRNLLVNHDFDLYVASYPSTGDPDELRSMLYSAYAEEVGWQNPFGFSDLSFDELLDEQRTTEREGRLDLVHEIQHRAVMEQPFTVVCVPDFIGAVRNERFDGWPAGGPRQPPEYFQLERIGTETTLKLLLANERVTRNRNPIAVEYRDQGDVIGLLYDSLIWPLRNEPDPVPWLAETVAWNEAGPTLSATVRIRETPWHDGEPVTARDVAFTYQFLSDTSLGEFETPVPTPWRRGRVSLIDSIAADTNRRLRIEFATTNRAVARRALVVPILPEHIWRERTGQADIAGIELGGPTTEALVDTNEAAIGSGPLQFVDAGVDESLSLEAFEEHFLYTGENEGIPDRFAGDRPFDRVEFTVPPSHDTAVELVKNGDTDGTVDSLPASVVPRLIRADGVSLTTRDADTFYHIGYNCRRAPMTDPNFRRAIARHIDRQTIVAESMDNYGVPSEAPLSGPWVPDDLRWDGEASLPFFGSEGDLNGAAARDAFQEAGYQYENDKLIRRDPQ